MLESIDPSAAPGPGDRSDSRGPSFETLEATLDVAYTWGYADTKDQLRELYCKAKRSQWDPDDAIDFSIDVDCERPAAPPEFHPLYGSDILAKLADREATQLNVEMSAWILSQFLH